MSCHFCKKNNIYQLPHKPLDFISLHDRNVCSVAANNFQTYFPVLLKTETENGTLIHSKIVFYTSFLLISIMVTRLHIGKTNSRDSQKVTLHNLIPFEYARMNTLQTCEKDEELQYARFQYDLSTIVIYENLNLLLERNKHNSGPTKGRLQTLMQFSNDKL